MIRHSILAIALALAAAGANAALPTDISLNGTWEFRIPDAGTDFPDSLVKGVTVTVPHTYNIMPGLEDYAGKAVYERILPVEPSMKGSKLRVKFGAVYHDAEIYVNGKKAGEHRDAGYTAFSVDITPYVDFSGGENRITVVTDNSYSPSNLPYKRSFDWNNDGGIYRDVSLHVSGPMAIRYAHVTPQLDLADSTATARFDIRLWDAGKAPRTADITIDVTDNATGRSIARIDRSRVKAGSDGTYTLTLDCGKVTPWHFDNPHLYSFRATVGSKGKVSDTVTDNFGFRTVAIEGNRLVLNGEPVRLPGIEDMPGSNPAMGAAESREYMAETVGKMKDLNCAITRYHWAQDDYRIHLMDSLGMLVQEELSWWGGPEKLTPELRATARRQLAELIETHYNHPSVYAWGLSNEVGDNEDELLSLREYCSALDSTRIYLAMSNGMNHRLTADPSCALDIPTFNDYIGSWLSRDRDILAETMKKIGTALDGRPLLITEAGLCEPTFSGGDSRRVDDMIYHISEWQRNDFITGYIYFCLEDYRTQIGEEGLGADKIRRHGVMTKTLEPKPSYGVLRQLMSPVEIVKVRPAGEKEDEKSLTNRYALDRSTKGVDIQLRNKASIPAYTLSGYSVAYTDSHGNRRGIPLGTMRPGEEIRLTLPEINSGYHFDVVRGDGSVAAQY